MHTIARRFVPYLLVAFIAAPFSVHAGYDGQIKACLEARDRGQAKSIKDYVCPEGLMGDQDVAYQVVLDLEFRKIDRDAAKRLKDMQSRMGKDFVQMDTDTSNWFDTTSKDSEFSDRYGKICSDLSDSKSVLGQTVAAFADKGGVTTDSQTARFAGNPAWCDTLVKRKLAAYAETSRLFTEQNVLESYDRDKKDLVDRLKDEYRNFLMKWMIYIGEGARIKDKWPNKTPVHNG